MTEHRARYLLKARFVAGVTAPGRYNDGGGLCLLVRRRGDAIERLWLFRFRRGPRGGSKETALSLGPAHAISLAQARELAGRCRSAIALGQDPRRLLGRAVALPTFGEFADRHVDSIAPGLRNAKHIAQWRMTLGDTYCHTLRRLRIDRVGTEDVLATLKPIWTTKPETAQRLRGRIERVLDAAAVAGLRSGSNPARWRGHLALLLARPTKLGRGHHAAVPWAEMPAFMARLRALDTVSALALEFTILTAARTGETIGATWAEIDLAARLWTVPAERMKAKREHRVPLCDRCLAVLEEARQLRTSGDWLFPGPRPGRPLSNMAMATCLKGLRPDATVHGFRSSFRDWVGEATGFSEQLAEAALAHIVGSKTERAYRRGDALERRRELMAAWATFLSEATGVVVPLRRSGEIDGAATRGDHP